jgi:uncharacterized OB-fold protein
MSDAAATSEGEASAMADYPHPAWDPDTQAFWRFCQAGELRIQRCLSCGAHRHHPRPRCPVCQSETFEWAACAGTGRIASYTICHSPVLPAFSGMVPYNVVVVELTEGPFMVSNLVDHDQEPEIDMPVTVTFKKIDEALTIPQFRPAL